jgi:hypothetical protein
MASATSFYRSAATAVCARPYYRKPVEKQLAATLEVDSLIPEATEDEVDLKLTGKIALVTGSTPGIEFAIAKSLAREGRMYT